jgi:hypothetical protein
LLLIADKVASRTNIITTARSAQDCHSCVFEAIEKAINALAKAATAIKIAAIKPLRRRRVIASLFRVCVSSVVISLFYSQC